MSSTSWQDGGDNWTTAADWSTGIVPDASTDVTVAQGNPTVNTDVGTIASLTNSSTLSVLGNSGTGDAKLSVNGTFANQGNAQINASSDNASIIAASIDNTSTLQLGGTNGFQAKLDVAGTAGFGTSGQLSGTVNLSGNSLVEFEGGGQITDIQGSLSLSGAQAFIADAGSITSNSALTGLSSVEGTLSLTDGPSITTSAALSNTGYVSLNASSAATSLTVGGLLTTTGFSGVKIQASGANATVTADAVKNNASNLELDGGTGGSPGLAKLDITGSAGFGTSGVLTGGVALYGNSLVEFEGGGQITDIKGTLILGSGQSLVADASDTTSNSALTGLSSVEGSLYVRNGSSVATSSNLDNSGQLSVEGGSGANTDLSVAGTLTNSGVAEVSTNNDGPATISAVGVDNTGTLTVSGSSSALAKLDITGSAGFGTSGVLTGTVQLSGDSLVEFEGGGQITDIKGTLILGSAQSLVADASDTTSNSALTGLSSVEGSIYVRNGSSVTTLGDLANSGQVIVQGGSGTTTTLSVTGTLTNSSYTEISTNGGAVTIGAASIDNSRL